MRAGRLVMNSGNARTRRHTRPTLGLSRFQGKQEAREEAIKVASQAMAAKVASQAMEAKALDRSESNLWTRTGAKDRSMIWDLETLSLRSGTGRCQSERREGLRI